MASFTRIQCIRRRKRLGARIVLEEEGEEACHLGGKENHSSSSQRRERERERKGFEKTQGIWQFWPIVNGQTPSLALMSKQKPSNVLVVEIFKHSCLVI